MLQAWKLSYRLLVVVPVIALMTATLAPRSASGVVLHPGYDSTSGLSKPDASVLASTGVVIGPNHILTARHVGGSVGSSITVAGKTYKVSKVTTFGSADLKLLHMKNTSGGNANFSKYAPLYTGSSEIGKNIVLMGRGKGRGSKMTYNGKTYGYYWGSGGFRTGANKVSGSGSLSAGGYTSQTISIDFDPVGSSSAVKWEAMNGGSDSGSGWFVYDGGRWKTIGIAIAVEHSGQSWFKSKYGMTDPDFNWAVRVSKYLSPLGTALGSAKAVTFGQTIPEPSTALAMAGVIGGMCLRRRR